MKFRVSQVAILKFLTSSSSALEFVIRMSQCFEHEKIINNENDDQFSVLTLENLNYVIMDKRCDVIICLIDVFWI